jgi:Domain of unknown function (DUF4166)
MRIVRPNPIPVQTPNSLAASELGDLRFCSLLGTQAWRQLPYAIQKRFSKRLEAGQTATYAGTIDHIEMSKGGRFLAQFLRIIGAPLPLRNETGVAAVVTVTEDGKTGGQIWSRLYASRSHFPQIIQSSKCFSGPTGLEEYIGFAIAMALTARTTDTAMIFESAGYCLKLGKWRLAIPSFMTPGQVTVTHEEVTGDTFRFTLQLAHRVFGILISQSGVFHEGRAK